MDGLFQIQEHIYHQERTFKAKRVKGGNEEMKIRQ